MKNKIKAVVETPQIITRRFNLTDLEPLGNWLVTRIRERWETMTDRMFPTFVKDWMFNNEYLFLCTKNAVGLCQVYYEPLDPQPYVREIFVYAKEGYDDDGIAIYAQFYQWAQGLGAAELYVCNDSDIPLDKIKQHITPVRTRSIYLVKMVA